MSVEKRCLTCNGVLAWEQYVCGKCQGARSSNLHGLPPEREESFGQMLKRHAMIEDAYRRFPPGRCW